MTTPQSKYCDYCKGTGRLYRSWKRSYDICTRCDGTGSAIPPYVESWREQRIRLQRKDT